MKKLVCIMLTVVMIMSAFRITTFAESKHEFQKYEQEFLQYLEENWYYPESFDYGYTYRVEYEHYDDLAETPTWALIYAYASTYDVGCYGVFDDYVLSASSGMPYGLGYYFYDLVEDKFYMFHEAWELGLVDMGELKAYGMVNISVLGDTNWDGNLTIMDATEIQLWLANKKELPDDYFFIFASCEYGPEIEHIADIDCDGSINIMDATHIQRKLAQIN